jgi:hypothetical protein
MKKSSRYSVALVSTTLLGSTHGVEANQAIEPSIYEKPQSIANDSFLSKLSTELRIAQATVKTASAGSHQGIRRFSGNEPSSNGSSIIPATAQERIMLAIEDFKVPTTLAQTISSTILSTRLRNIVRDCSLKYEIVLSSVDMEEMSQRFQQEQRYIDNPDPMLDDSFNAVKAEKILIPQVFLYQHQLFFSAKLLDKKSLRQQEYYMKFHGDTITNEVLCSFWKKIEPNGNFATGICALQKVEPANERQPTWATSGSP